MPGSAIASSGGAFAGLELKAWAYITPTTGAVVKQSGIASVVRNSPGNYTLTPNAAFPNASIADIRWNHGNASVIGTATSFSAGSLTMSTLIGGSAADVGGMLFVAVYG